MDKYKEMREELSNLLDFEYQNLEWETLEKFTNELSRVRENGFTLYRYSPADFYNIRNFECGKLWLADNGSLNDIYEGFPVCGITDKDRSKLSKLSDCAYIKCFSENFNSNTMWAHYADNHRGICVAYDLALLDHGEEVLEHIFPVLYQEQRPFSRDQLSEICDAQKWLNYDIFNDAYPENGEILNDALLLFLRKGKEWESEQEWRIIYSKYQLYEKSETNVINNIIDFDCASAIYLGQRINPEIRKNIEEIVERINTARKNTHKPNINIYCMKFDEKTYRLHEKRVR